MGNEIDLRNINLERLKEEYCKYKQRKSCKGYIFGWHSRDVFEFLRELQTEQLNSGFIICCGQSIFVGRD